MRKTNLRPLVVREIDRLIASKAAWLTQRYGLQPADTADIRQEGWVAALRTLPGYSKTGSSLGTYLAPRVLFHMLNVILRAQSRGMTGGVADLQDIETAVPETPGADSDDADEIAGPYLLQDLLMDEGQADALLANIDAHAALQRLGMRERNLIALYFGLSGGKPMTLADLAARNRQSVGTIYRRIQRGLDMLKDDLEQEDTEE